MTEQQNKRKTPRSHRGSNVIFLERALIESQAFILLTGKAPQVLAIFRTKLRMEHRGPKGRREWVIVNNGQIVFLYAEARRFGLSNFQFASAIGQLLEHGFLKITQRGGQNQPTLYAISDDWRQWRPGDKIAERAPDRRAHMVEGARAARAARAKRSAPTACAPDTRAGAVQGSVGAGTASAVRSQA